VESGDGIEMVQLENGCVCCSAAGDLVPAVSKLLERDDPFDHVVIEMSGVADPENVENSLGARRHDLVPRAVWDGAEGGRAGGPDGRARARR